MELMLLGNFGHCKLIFMAQRQKPPGFEKWTWEEIRAGRRIPKAEKRWRKIAKSMGATEKPDGRIQPPSEPENPGYYLFFGGALALLIIFGVAFPGGCAR